MWKAVFVVLDAALAVNTYRFADGCRCDCITTRIVLL